MPELPEVQTTVNTLQPLIVGKAIRDVTLNRKDILQPSNFDLPNALVGKTITSIHRRAKRIVISLSDQNRFYIHLGMTGRLSVEPNDQPLLPHTHLIVHFGTTEMRFRDPRRFGGIWWMGTDQTSEQNLGPEPLTISPRQLQQQLSKTTRAIKTALLDQSIIAGLGNIYVDESLFGAGIHPLTPAKQLTTEQIMALTKSIKRTLKKALHHRGSTLRDYLDANGSPGAFQKLHLVYDRADLPCRKCKTPVTRLVLTGRSTHFCATCQPIKRSQLGILKRLQKSSHSNSR